ncbi:Carbohydrate-binding protein [Phytophthora cinnamomi]|uniref:Carbohydrate-binding protein n=1 Tax=Phytophthora cinnamomi TaxID=4785 RepID=UPI00355A0E8A|nr:Carbohydrate-binding protein [Phytophthora cinnamomi]
MSFRQIALLVAAALPAMALAGSDSYFTGDGTSYTLGQVSAGNCNFMYDPGVGDNYAALNSAQWDSTLNCGRCAEVSCADSRCSDTSSSVTVYIVDKCPECSQGDLDLSPTVFKQLTGSDPSRYSIKWKFVDCPVSGNIEYCAKSGSSSSWLAVQPANFANGVASMKIANQDVTMVDSCYYFLLSGGSNVDMSAVDIELTSISGETITETLSLTADNCTAGSSNFGGSTTQQSSTSQTSQSSETTSAPVSTTPTPTTAAPVATTAAPTATPTSYTESSDSASQSQSQQQSEVSTYFSSLTTNSSSGSDNSYKAGKVTAASGDLSILQSSEVGVEKSSSTKQSESTKQDESDTTKQDESDSTKQDESDSTKQQDSESDSTSQKTGSDTKQATTKSASTSASTSPVIVTLVVLAVVGAIALAAVALMAKKKKLNDKRIDRDQAMIRSFDTFSSPVHINETNIAAI